MQDLDTVLSALLLAAAEAEEHARFHAIPESDHDFEYPGEDVDEDDYERCGCEDPGCPCDGVKWGAYSLP